MNYFAIKIINDFNFNLPILNVCVENIFLSSDVIGKISKLGSENLNSGTVFIALETSNLVIRHSILRPEHS